MLSTLAVGFASLFVWLLIYEYWRDRKLPPGPRRLPLIGNLHQAPADQPWLTFDKWLKEYGPIVSVQFGGNTIILLGDLQIARELMDKRANIYSDRPRMVMAGECLTKGMHLLLRPFSERYLLHQRLGAPVLSPRASNTYYPLQDWESKFLLFQFLNSNDFCYQFERYSASLIYSLAYGFRIITGEEQSLKEAHQVQANFAYAGRVGTWIVDAIPALNRLPDALAPWRKTAEQFYQVEKALHLRNLKTGLECQGWTWAKEFKLSKESSPMDEVEMAYSLGILADAGLDTTVVFMECFVLAALAQPGFIAKAQKELDEVVGPDRLPNLQDREKLPYIRGVVEETMRWRHIAPSGVPHATMEEDNYKGYRIPKGATIMPNFWTMRLDEKVYDNPQEFRPERWFGKPDGPNAFGYGRRVCTGRFIAKNSIYLLVARLLWAYDIKHALDKDGKKIEVDDMAFTSGFVSKPMPFPAVFTPRSKRAEEVITGEWDSTEKDLNVVLDSIKQEQIRVGLNVRA